MNVMDEERRNRDRNDPLPFFLSIFWMNVINNKPIAILKRIFEDRRRMRETWRISTAFTNVTDEERRNRGRNDDPPPSPHLPPPFRRRPACLRAGVRTLDASAESPCTRGPGRDAESRAARSKSRREHRTIRSGLLLLPIGACAT